MRKIGLAIVALGLLGGSARAELLAQVALNGVWQGGAYSNDNTHQFNGCTATAPYLSGISMFVTVDRTYGWALGFRSEAWNLQTNQQIPLSDVRRPKPMVRNRQSTRCPYGYRSDGCGLGTDQTVPGRVPVED